MSAQPVSSDSTESLTLFALSHPIGFADLTLANRLRCPSQTLGQHPNLPSWIRPIVRLSSKTIHLPARIGCHHNGCALQKRDNRFEVEPASEGRHDNGSLPRLRGIRLVGRDLACANFVRMHRSM